jgi:hypothetical protein
MVTSPKRLTLWIPTLLISLLLLFPVVARAQEPGSVVGRVLKIEPEGRR